MTGRPVVIIDPGHGGDDPGAIGVYAGVPVAEESLVLDYALDLYDVLRDKGCCVYMTRYADEDTSLAERAYAAYVVRADAFVSLHANAGPAAARGFEVFYAEENVGGYGLAESIVKSVVNSGLIAVRGGEKPRKDTESARRSLYVLRHCGCPAALVELGFLTNEEDLAFLKSDEGRLGLVMSVLEGVLAFVGVSDTKLEEENNGELDV